MPQRHDQRRESTEVVAALRATADRLAIEMDGGALSDLDTVISGPLEHFLSHPNWPTGLVGFRSPLLVSVDVSPEGGACLRLLVDVTDHRTGLVDNWSHYLHCARTLGRLTPAGQHRLWQALVASMDGIAPLYRSRVLLGVRFGPARETVADVSVSTRWMSGPRLARTFTEHLPEPRRAALAELLHRTRSVNHVSFECRGDDVSSPTLSLALEPMSKAQLVGLVERTPGMRAAGAVVDEIWPSWERTPENSTIVALPLEPGAAGSRDCRLHLDVELWQLGRVGSLATLLGLVESRAAYATAPLDALLRVHSDLGRPLRPSALAIGGTDLSAASVRFDLYPADLSGPAVPASRRPTDAGGHTDLDSAVGRAIERAVSFLVDSRTSGTHWEDFDVREAQYEQAQIVHAGVSDELVTGYVLSTLAAVPDRPDLDRSARWLAGRARRGTGWGWNSQSVPNCEATCLALLALSALGQPLPAEHPAMLDRYRLGSGGYVLAPELDLDHGGGQGSGCLSGLALSVLAAEPAAGRRLSATARTILAQRRGDRGWSSFWWREDLVATGRVLHGFAAARTAVEDGSAVRADEDGSAVRAEMEWALRNTWPAVQARPVGDDPFSLAAWLDCWGAGGGSWTHPSVRRILGSLLEAQRPDGRWWGSPTRRLAGALELRPWTRADSGQMFIDHQCVVTTATVLRGLLRARQGLELIAAPAPVSRSAAR